MRKKITSLILVLVLVLGNTIQAQAATVSLIHPFDYTLARSGRTVTATTYSYYGSPEYSYFISLACSYTEGNAFDIVKSKIRVGGTTKVSTSVKIPKGRQVISYTSYHEIYYRGKLIKTEDISINENLLD